MFSSYDAIWLKSSVRVYPYVYCLGLQLSGLSIVSVSRTHGLNYLYKVLSSHVDLKNTIYFWFMKAEGIVKITVKLHIYAGSENIAVEL